MLVGIGDDMAVLETAGQNVLITSDTLLEGVHFDLNKATLAQVGYKAMACSLSDCAAMAAVPFAAVVAVALPGAMSMAQAKELHAGLEEAAVRYCCPIVGGDTTSWDKPLAITVTMLARGDDVEPVLRSGAHVGDAVLVTGKLGGSGKGRHLQFEPRLDEARKLAKMADVTAMIDLSDGLSSDLIHICRASGVSAIVDAGAIPVSAAAKQATDPLKAALGDGEDFELLLCMARADADRVLGCWDNHSDVPLTLVGEIVDRATLAKRFGNDIFVFLRDDDGAIEPLAVSGWEHFRD